MKSINLTRLTIGVIIIFGLLFYQPLVYLVGVMMIFAGLTSICLLEKFYTRVFGCNTSCTINSDLPAKNIRAMSPGDIKQAVKNRYDQVAAKPAQRFNFPVGRKFAESVGYPAELLDKLPASLWESFTGAGNPHAYVDVKQGETLLDLGCGAGLDLYLYAKIVGDKGNVYGLDLAEAMLAKARRNLELLNVRNAKFLCAPADKIPLPDNSVDIITANGIYNLSPDKGAVMREVARVLRPGGRTIFAEIVLKNPLPEDACQDINDWFRCIGGALTQDDFLKSLESAGLSNP
ncbi:MAG: hypothetical protein A2788_01850, partial [Candidatus Abawacabacteria bacterium RIFCSPHIGHO2_01_FULL_46_8]